MELVLSKSVLRPWRFSDAPSLAYHANNPRIAQNLRDGFPNPYTLKDAEYWISNMANISTNLIFAIVVDDNAVGAIGIHPQNDVYRKNAEFGYWLGEAFWGQGIVSEASVAVIKLAFERFAIHRVYAGVFEFNTPSMRVLEKCGFTREAIHRKAVIKNNVIMDEYLYSLCLI